MEIDPYYKRQRDSPGYIAFSDVQIVELDFKITTFFNVISRKWYKTELYFHWQTGRKSYKIYRIAPFSMTLNDPKLDFKEISQKCHKIEIKLQWNTNTNLHLPYSTV